MKEASTTALDLNMLPDMGKQAAGNVKNGTNWVQKDKPTEPRQLEIEVKKKKKSRPLSRKPKTCTLEEFNYLMQLLNGKDKPIHIASGPYYYNTDK